MDQDLKTDLVSDDEAATIIHQKKNTLATWRSYGKGPPFYKIGRRVFYSIADLHAWMASRRREPKKAAAAVIVFFVISTISLALFAPAFAGDTATSSPRLQRLIQA
jgi:hypothetical protein